MTQTNVQYVLQTSERRYCSRWVNISEKKKNDVVPVARSLSLRGQDGGYTCQFRLHLRSVHWQKTEEMGGPALDTSTLCLFDVDGTLTAPRQVEWTQIYHSARVLPCVASPRKTSGSTLEVATKIEWFLLYRQKLTVLTGETHFQILMQ